MKRRLVIALVLLTGLSLCGFFRESWKAGPVLLFVPIPSGVTFQCLDGETVGSSWVAPGSAGTGVTDPNTCTHNYYSRNSLTYVTSNSTFGSQANFNWDSKDFFISPIFDVKPDPAYDPNIATASGACGGQGCTAMQFIGVDALESTVIAESLPLAVWAGICGNGGPGGSTCGNPNNGQVQGPTWTDVGNPTPQPLVVGINLGETQDPRTAFGSVAAGVLDHRVLNMTMQQSDINGTMQRIQPSFTATIDNGSGSAGTVLTVSAVAYGKLIPGQVITGAGVSGTQAIITDTGGGGGVGTYTVSTSQLIASETMTAKDPHALVFEQGAMSSYTSVAQAQQLGSVDFDLYFFAEQANQADRNNQCAIFAAGTSCGGSPWGTRQVASGSLYGGVVDEIRSFANRTNFEMPGTNRGIRYKNCGGPPPTITLGSCTVAHGYPSRIPVMIDLEVQNGNAGAPNINISAREFTWALWSIVIHGGHPQPFLGNPGLGAWITTATPYTNFINLTQSLAPVLNEPYALNYASGTIPGNTASGGRGLDYKFPTWPWTFTTSILSYGFNSEGIETMVKYYNKGSRTINGRTITNGFYLFADTSASEWADNQFTNTTNVTSTITNASATFTGGITGTTLTVDGGSVSAGGIGEPQTLSFAGAIANTVIIADTGGNGGAGTYTVSQNYGTPVSSGTAMTSATTATFSYAEDSRGDGTRTVPVFYATWGASNPTATCAGGAGVGTCTFTLTFPTTTDVAIFGPL